MKYAPLFEPIRVGAAILVIKSGFVKLTVFKECSYKSKL